MQHYWPSTFLLKSADIFKVQNWGVVFTLYETGTGTVIIDKDLLVCFRSQFVHSSCTYKVAISQ